MTIEELYDWSCKLQIQDYTLLSGEFMARDFKVEEEDLDIDYHNETVKVLFYRD